MPQDEESNVPAIIIGFVVVVALVVGGGFWLMTQRRLEMVRLAEMEALEVANKARSEEILWKQEQTIRDVEDGKLQCEQNARLIKKLAGSQRDKEKALLTKGEALYSTARKNSDECLDYLSANLKIRFEKLDIAELTKRMKESRDSTVVFLKWSDKELGQEESSIVGPWSEILESHPNWFEKFHPINYDDASIEEILASLEKCRMKSWNEIK
jgi:hypothetical protein